MHIPIPRKLAVTMAAATLFLGFAACGDDDDDTADTAALATTAAPANTTTPETTVVMQTVVPAGDVAAFCEAELAVEAAIGSEDEAAIGPAVEQVLAAAPADIAGTVETVIAEIEASGGESPEFEAAYGEMLQYMKDNCGFTTVDVTAAEYAFGGLPAELPAGPAIFSLENVGEEFHEMIVFRVNDDVTETVEELFDLPDEEFEAKATFAAAGFVPLGATSYATADLQPGRYIAVCFLPEGATPEVMAQMEGPDSSLPPGAGPPHFTHGMVQEFEVA